MPVDVASGSTGTVIPVGLQPTGVAAGPGNRIWVAVTGADQLVWFDTTAASVTANPVSTGAGCGPVALVAVGVALVAGTSCWLIGETLGPGPFPPRMAAATAGESVPVSLRLYSVSALALWPFAAVAVPLFAASLGPEVAHVNLPWRRRAARPAPAEPVGALAPAAPDEAP